MTRLTTSVPDAWFQALYKGGRDPWGFATSEYEREKYAATLAKIGRDRIRRAWEVGCAIGVFTQALALQCDYLLAIDVAESALIQARARCIGLRHVYFECMRVPQRWPTGKFDLIVFSEVLYYLAPDDLLRTAGRIAESLSAAGRVLLVNCTGETDYPCSGDEAAELFIAATRMVLRPLQQRSCPRYRLDQAHSLQQAPQRRALRGVGAAAILFGGGSRGLQIPPQLDRLLD